MKQLYFITTNEYKFARFTSTASIEGFEVLQLKEETPEIQASDNRQVAEFSAKWAAEKFQHAVLKEDVGLYIDAYGGFPGPYLSQVEKQLETAGFLRLLEGIEDRKAHWEYSIAYCEPSKAPISFFTHHKGNIAIKAQGRSGWYADKLFIPEGQPLTVAELLDNNTYVRDERHYEALKEYLRSFSVK